VPVVMYALPLCVTVPTPCWTGRRSLFPIPQKALGYACVAKDTPTQT
jgi:hypothetical protein